MLELRPSRKRSRELISGLEDEDYLPFSEDVDMARHLRPRHEGQAPFVDVAEDVPDSEMPQEDAGVIANPAPPVLALEAPS